MSQDQVVVVKILERFYKIKCPDHAKNDLQLAAKYIDAQMRKTKETCQVTNTDRLAVLAALNICNELIQTKRDKNKEIEEMSLRIHNLQERIDTFLTAEREINV